jgi:hypothetical protein
MMDGRYLIGLPKNDIDRKLWLYVESWSPSLGHKRQVSLWGKGLANKGAKPTARAALLIEGWFACDIGLSPKQVRWWCSLCLEVVSDTKVVLNCKSLSGGGLRPGRFEFRAYIQFGRLLENQHIKIGVAPGYRQLPFF